MLTIENTALVLIDVQGKLASLMFDRERLFNNLVKLIRGARALGLPIVWMEQNPERMGPTLPRLAELLQDLTPLPKMSFSGCGDAAIQAAIEKTGRRQFILSGIEAHVCVYQTAAHLRARGFEVHVPANAVSSREREDRDIALQRMAARGAEITTVESALFELMGTASHPAFRDMLKIVK